MSVSTQFQPISAISEIRIFDKNSTGADLKKNLQRTFFAKLFVLLIKISIATQF